MNQFSPVTQSCPTLYHPMNHSTSGLPVHHQLLEFTQTHVHWVGDAIQPSHPLVSPSPLPSIFPSIRVFSNESALHIRWPKYRSFRFSISPSNEYSGLISFRMDWLNLLAVQGRSPWKKSYDQPRQHIKKQRNYFSNKCPCSQSYGFSSSHVWMWELDYLSAEELMLLNCGVGEDSWESLGDPTSPS